MYIETEFDDENYQALNFGLFAEISTWNESTRFYLTGWMIALIVLSVLFIVGLVISLYMAYKYWR